MPNIFYCNVWLSGGMGSTQLSLVPVKGFSPTILTSYGFSPWPASPLALKDDFLKR